MESSVPFSHLTHSIIQLTIEINFNVYSSPWETNLLAFHSGYHWLVGYSGYHFLLVFEVC